MRIAIDTIRMRKVPGTCNVGSTRQTGASILQRGITRGSGVQAAGRVSVIDVDFPEQIGIETTTAQSLNDGHADLPIPIRIGSMS